MKDQDIPYGNYTLSRYTLISYQLSGKILPSRKKNNVINRALGNTWEYNFYMGTYRKIK